MINEVIDENYERIRDDLVRRGLTYDPLVDDVLDHVCCLVEAEMGTGSDFDASYCRVLDSIGEKRLPELQHQTLINLDNKFQRMKQFTYICGLSGAILTLIGAFFKTMHWPGASIVLVFGFLLVGLVFLPLYFIVSYREQAEKPHPVYPLIGFLTLFLILAGAVFKLMHWPGAGIVLRVSLGVLLIGFVPLFIVQFFQKKSGRRVNVAYVVMLLIGISIIALLTRINLSKDSVDRYTELSRDNLESAGMIESQIEGKVGTLADSLRTSSLMEILQQAEELQAMTEQMRTGLLERVDQAGVPIDRVSGRDFRNAARDAIFDNGVGARFLEDTRSYRDGLMGMTGSPAYRSQIAYLLRFAGENPMVRWNVVENENVYDPLIIYYYQLTDFSRRIAFSTYLALEDLSGGDPSHQ